MKRSNKINLSKKTFQMNLKKKNKKLKKFKKKNDIGNPTQFNKISDKIKKIKTQKLNNKFNENSDHNQLTLDARFHHRLNCRMLVRSIRPFSVLN